jgi:hypothetical protein
VRGLGELSGRTAEDERYIELPMSSTDAFVSRIPIVSMR